MHALFRERDAALTYAILYTVFICREGVCEFEMERLSLGDRRSHGCYNDVPQGVFQKA